MVEKSQSVRGVMTIAQKKMGNPVKKHIKKKESVESGKEAGKESSKVEGGKNEKKVRVKVVEGVICIPYTPESHLREELQRVEDVLITEMHTPGLRFVERGGETVTEVLGRNNPWSKESECGRKNCPPCWGRRWLAEKKEKESLALVTG